MYQIGILFEIDKNIQKLHWFFGKIVILLFVVILHGEKKRGKYQRHHAFI